MCQLILYTNTTQMPLDSIETLSSLLCLFIPVRPSGGGFVCIKVILWLFQNTHGHMRSLRQLSSMVPFPCTFSANPAWGPDCIFQSQCFLILNIVLVLKSEGVCSLCVFILLLTGHSGWCRYQNKVSGFSAKSKQSSIKQQIASEWTTLVNTCFFFCFSEEQAVWV